MNRLKPYGLLLVGSVLAHFGLVFGVGGFSETTWIIWGGLAVIDAIVVVIGALDHL